MPLVVAALVVLAGLLANPVQPAPGTTAREAKAVPHDLTSQQFWRLSSDLSEPGAPFISDNLVSNEMSFALVLPELEASTSAGGIYLGVGPEQNFTFLEATKARLGFILDIRRENLLLHLLYKAIFELAPDRAAFLSRLFSRPMPSIEPTRSAAELLQALSTSPTVGESAFNHNTDAVRRVLMEAHQFPLSGDDWRTLVESYGAFREFGPAIDYATSQTGRPVGPASYRNLMQQVDEGGRELGFLRSEESYQFVRELQVRNLVVPVVGNFAGPKALRAIGDYLRGVNATVSIFYVSNVEDYLGREASIPPNGAWRVFCENVASLPIDDRSVFVRPPGHAALDAAGRWVVSDDMLISSTASRTYPAGERPALPSSVTPIAPEVAACGR